MKLGTILGGKAWGELNRAAKELREAAKKSKREQAERAKRRKELEAQGFKPIGGKRS